MKKYLFTVILLVAMVMGNNAMAALSAVISLSPSTATINQLVTASVAISNSSASALSLSSLAITANYNGSLLSRIPAALDVFSIAPNAPAVVIPANGAVTVPMKAVFFSPSTGPIGGGGGRYYIGANFVASDGTVTSAATAAILSVNPIALPASEQ